MTLPLESVRQLVSIDRTGFFLRFVELAAYERSPGLIMARRSVEDKRMRVQLRV
jgi:hypothetical protein